jgi:hypothetical protein
MVAVTAGHTTIRLFFALHYRNTNPCFSPRRTTGAVGEQAQMLFLDPVLYNHY